MAKSSISDEELQLRKRARRRLIGAVALVTLVVVFLPMVLDDEPKPLDRDIAIEIPAPGADDSPPKALPPATQPAAAVSSPHAAEPIAPAPASAPADASKPADATAPKAEQGAAAPAETADKPVKESYVVQIGTYANPDNAKQAHKKIVAAGIKAYTETIKTPQGDKTRVRAGPFSSHEAASKAQAKLKAIGLDGPIASKPLK